MLNRYKNGFIEIIQDNGFDYKIFKVEEEGNEFYLNIKNAPLVFITVIADESFHNFQYFHTEFKPQFPVSRIQPIVGFLGIDEIYKAFDKWLKEVVRKYFDEISVPDLWKQAETQQDFVSGDVIEDKELKTYSNDEKEQVKFSINEFKLLIIKNFNPNKDELKVIENRLNYLSNSLDRLNKLDWRGLAISTVMSISIALSLDTEKGKTLFDLFKQVFVNAIKFIQQ